jgi:RNA polymerase sigma-70 factor (ECF subfamily)
VAAAANDAEPHPGTRSQADAERREELVRRCRAGDAGAFRELFRTYREEVARLVHRMLGQTDDLEDVIQEVFCQVHRSLPDFRGQARFSTWLYRVTVNVVLMHRRAARSRPVLVTGTDRLSLPAPDAPPDEQVARRNCVAAFRRLLDRLSEKKRAVFILHELEGLPPAEVAAIVGAPVLTVRTRLFYARRELGRMLEEEPELRTLAMDVEAAVDADSLVSAGLRR